jgi:hypothetical protein
MWGKREMAEAGQKSEERDCGVEVESGGEADRG